MPPIYARVLLLPIRGKRFCAQKCLPRTVGGFCKRLFGFYLHSVDYHVNIIKKYSLSVNRTIFQRLYFHQFLEKMNKYYVKTLDS